MGVVIYGERPPIPVDLDDLCPAPPPCPNDCPDPKETVRCHDGGVSLFNLAGRMEIRAFENVSVPGLPNRTMGEWCQSITTKIYYFYFALERDVRFK